MRVVLSDIEAGPLDEAVAGLRGRGLDATAVVADVTKWPSVANLRDQALAAYGKVNVAFLNAGVAGGGGKQIWDIDLKDWEWTIAVNVWGVIHGIRALVPAILDAQKEEGHVVITSSSVGVVAPVPSGAAYNLSKAADCSLAETLQGQLRVAGVPVSASVLVPPGTINTGLFTVARNRGDQYQPDQPAPSGPPLTYEAMLERMQQGRQPPALGAAGRGGRVRPRRHHQRHLLDPPRRVARRHARPVRRYYLGPAQSMLDRTDPTTYLQNPTWRSPAMTVTTLDGTPMKVIDTDTHYSEPATCGRHGCRRSTTSWCPTGPRVRDGQRLAVQRRRGAVAAAGAGQRASARTAPRSLWDWNIEGGMHVRRSTRRRTTRSPGSR